MRLVNRLVAGLVYVVVVVGSVLLMVEVVADRVGHRPVLVHWRSFYGWAGRTQWQAGVVRVVCVLLVLAGLVLLVGELKRPRVSRLRLVEEVAGIDAAFTRRGVARAVKAAVGEVDGIGSVRSGVSRRKVRVSAVASATDKAAAQRLRGPVQAAAQQRLDGLGLRSVPVVSVAVTARGK